MFRSMEEVVNNMPTLFDGFIVVLKLPHNLQGMLIYPRDVVLAWRKVRLFLRDRLESGDIYRISCNDDDK